MLEKREFNSICMLGSVRKAKAKNYARELADDGMIWGTELENYIKKDAIYSNIKLSNKEIDLYVDAVIEWVEWIYAKNVVVYDSVKNESIIYNSIEEAAESINYSTTSLYYSINKKASIKKRYYANRYNPKISELNNGIKNLDRNKRPGRIN